MEALILSGSAKTPHVYFDQNMGVLDLRGRSNPGNSISFYRPLIDWVDAYTSKALSKTIVNVQLEYFNTSSSKCLLDLFKKLETIAGSVVIQWYFEQDDEDMLEAGEDYEAIIDLPFKMIEIEEMNDLKRASSYAARINHLHVLCQGKNNRSIPPLSA